MATWIKATYGGQSWRRLEYWIPSDDEYPATNPLRPCLIYCPGHGWEGRHPNFFYGPAGDGVAEPLFTARIEPAEVTEPVVAISIWQASSNYGLADVFNPDPWTTSTAYVVEDMVTDGVSTRYRCVKDHTSSAADEVGVGANWEFKWLAIPANDVTAQLWSDEPYMSPAFGGTGIRDAQAAVQWAKRNADRLGIDPNKIVLMGSSAGGQACGAAAWSRSRPHLDEDAHSVTRDFAYDQSSSVQGVILDITPNDWKWYPFEPILMPNLWGRKFTTTQWDRYPDRLKSALSPLGSLNATGIHTAAYLAYAGSRFDHAGGTDDPPYSAALYHEARNGWEMLAALKALGQTNVVFLEDAAGAGFFERWTSQTASTQIADTDRDLDIWDWLKALWGL